MGEQFMAVAVGLIFMAVAVVLWFFIFTATYDWWKEQR